MNFSNSVIPIWQPQGYSTNHISQILGSKFNVKATHTGTLDPMASGVIVVLTGEQRLKRFILSDFKKTYKFDIVFGISTDTFDAMGVILENKLNNTLYFSASTLEKICNQLIGSYTQTIPIFSAHIYKGKKLFEYGQNNQDVPLPLKAGTIYSLKVLKIKSIKLSSIVNKIIKKINCVKGNFRQEKIISQYKSLIKKENINVNVVVASFMVQTSKGIYIRSLSQDICKKLNAIGFTYNIVRTFNGEYSINNSYSLIDFFGINYDKIIYLQS